MNEETPKTGDNVRIKNEPTTRTITVSSVDEKKKIIIGDFINDKLEKATAQFSFDEIEVIKKSN